MPGGFMTAYLTAWVPPLWRKRITPKLREWDAKYASQNERPLATEANERSRWAELRSAASQAVGTQVPSA